LLVRGLSVRTGHTGDQRGRLVWAQIPWDGLSPAVPASSQDSYQTAIRDGEAALARRFAGVPAWFGRSTLAWWALAGRDGLVSAPSARELAGLLYRLLDSPASPQLSAAGQAHPRATEEPAQQSGRGPGALGWPPHPGGPRTPPEPAEGGPAPQMAGTRRPATARHSSLSCCQPTQQGPACA
jgi:hypothetical protein